MMLGAAERLADGGEAVRDDAPPGPLAAFVAPAPPGPAPGPAASASDSGRSVIGGPHNASPTMLSGIVRVLRPAAIPPHIDSDQCEPDTGHIDTSQSTGWP